MSALDQAARAGRHAHERDRVRRGDREHGRRFGDAGAAPRVVGERGFDVRELSADKAYLSNENLVAIEAVGAVPYVPFKSNSKGTGRTDARRRLWHMFEAQNDQFLAHYHKRSNVESTFSMIKRKFGASVRAKAFPAQVNEVLLKCLCHNLSVLVHAIHELRIDPVFWQRLEAH